MMIFFFLFEERRNAELGWASFLGFNLFVCKVGSRHDVDFHSGRFSTIE